MTTMTFARTNSVAAARVPIADDRAMLKAAAELTRDLNAPRPAIYWADLLGSALVGYVALGVAIAAGPLWLTLIAGVVSFWVERGARGGGAQAVRSLTAANR